MSAVTFSPDGTLIATADRGGAVRLWDAATRTPAGSPLTDHLGPITSVVFSPTGTLLAVANDGGAVRLWVPTTQQAAGEPLTGHDGLVTGIAFSPDGRLIATATDSRHGVAVGLHEPSVNRQAPGRPRWLRHLGGLFARRQPDRYRWR